MSRKVVEQCGPSEFSDEPSLVLGDDNQLKLPQTPEEAAFRAVAETLDLDETLIDDGLTPKERLHFAGVTAAVASLALPRPDGSIATLSQRNIWKIHKVSNDFPSFSRAFQIMGERKRQELLTQPNNPAAVFNFTPGDLFGEIFRHCQTLHKVPRKK